MALLSSLFVPHETSSAKAKVATKKRGKKEKRNFTFYPAFSALKFV